GPARRPGRGEHRGPLSRLRSFVRGAGASVNPLLAPAAVPVLRAEGLGRRYGRRWALRECSFDIPSGRVVALVGPNGAGKTTLLHLAVGLLRATAGSIQTLGEAPAAAPEHVARIGFAPLDATADP